MKQSQSSNGTHQSQKMHVENKDNLDSRHKEEETVKGNHLTNNQKERSSLNKQH